MQERLQAHGPIRRDFASSIEAPAGARAAAGRRDSSKPNRRHVRVGAAAAAALTLGLMALAGGKPVVADTEPPTREEWLQAAAPPAPSAPERRVERVRAGDAAVSVLSRLGFPLAEITRMLAAARPAYDLRRIVAGHRFERVDAGQATDVFYDVDSRRLLRLREADGRWRAALLPRVATTRETVVSGEITDSLFAAAARAGLDERTTMNLVDIFAWDVDFVRDLRPHDSFRVLLSEQYDREGRLLGRVIEAAEFVNQGHVYRAIRYRLPDGRVEYYAPDGRSMRKTYLKAPVKFTRISSRFSLARKHPILGYTRAHRGVDYAAPTGTPIHAVGDGRVVFAGWKGGYGRFILIRHTNRMHATAYGHLSRIARGIRRGARVRQGQVIGYVGMSGLATGPHLHFEFRVRGRPVNPLTIKRTPARPVPASQMASFRTLAGQRLARMEQSPTLLAWE